MDVNARVRRTTTVSLTELKNIQTRFMGPWFEACFFMFISKKRFKSTAKIGSNDGFKVGPGLFKLLPGHYAFSFYHP